MIFERNGRGSGDENLLEVGIRSDKRKEIIKIGLRDVIQGELQLSQGYGKVCLKVEGEQKVGRAR